MKRTLMLAMLLGPPATHGADGWFGVDKLKHFVVSAVLQSISFAALETAGVERDAAVAGATVLTLGVGIGKEWHDRSSGRIFSVRDLAWDAAGAGAATVLLMRVPR